MEISPRRSRNAREYARLNAYTVAACALLAFALVALIFTAWFTAVKIADDGMAPALTKGQVVLCDKLAKFFVAPKRGDMYCYKDTLGAGVYTGRIIALPGDTVAIFEGRLYVNGGLLLEDYIDFPCAEDMEAVAVETGEYFILPDNRQNVRSFATEELVIGANRLLGRIAFRVWPIEDAAAFG